MLFLLQKEIAISDIVSRLSFANFLAGDKKGANDTFAIRSGTVSFRNFIFYVGNSI